MAFNPPCPIESKHKTDKFSSGEISLDDWLKTKALKNHASGASRTFVISEDEHICGYYCLSAGVIAHQQSPKKLNRNMPDPLPILLMGRLAIDKNYQGLGLGAALLKDAMLRCLNIANDAGIVALVVHALHENAKQFYLQYGFLPSPNDELTLILPIATMKDGL